MIQINLLGKTKPKSKRGAAMAASDDGNGRYGIAQAESAGGGVWPCFNWATWYRWTASRKTSPPK